MIPKTFCTVLAVLAFACDAQADRAAKPTARPPTSPASAASGAAAAPTPAAPTPAAPTPEVRARAVVDAQLKALRSDNAPLNAMFAKDAVVLLPRYGAKVEPDLELRAAIAELNPHAIVKSAKLAKLVAGGSSSMIWFAAELDIVVWSHEPGEPDDLIETHHVRAVELLDAASDWKVAAASFTRVQPLQQYRTSLGPIPSPTAPGTLAKLLASPDAVASSLARDPIVVFGTDGAERAVGQTAAKALLAKWRKLPLAIEEADKIREVHTSGWGYAMANVNLAKTGDAPFRMSAFVIAVPEPSGSWSVVAVSYGAL